MILLYKNKYKRVTRRLKGYDYSSPGKYFVTINTKNKYSYLGDIVHGSVVLSDTGVLVNKYWLEIPFHFPGIRLDEFVIMPDHLHGIIIIESDKNNDHVSYNLGLIINQFKRICTINTTKKNLPLTWQARYHDIVIRNNHQLSRIRQYIRDNPSSRQA
jgi:REP element-mobilizing transposase RayT